MGINMRHAVAFLALDELIRQLSTVHTNVEPKALSAKMAGEDCFSEHQLQVAGIQESDIKETFGRVVRRVSIRCKSENISNMGGKIVQDDDREGEEVQCEYITATVLFNRVDKNVGFLLHDTIVCNKKRATVIKNKKGGKFSFLASPQGRYLLLNILFTSTLKLTFLFFTSITM